MQTQTNQPFLSLEKTRSGRIYVKKAFPEVALVIAITEDNCFLLTEQVREPVNSRVIEWAAGHIGDDPGHKNEGALLAAERELLEETGYGRGSFSYLGATVSSPGVVDEINHFVLATNLMKVASGGGIGEEDITVHKVHRQDLMSWLVSRKSEVTISDKLYAGLALAQNYLPPVNKVGLKYEVVGTKLDKTNRVVVASVGTHQLAETCLTSAIQSGVWQDLWIREQK